MPNYTNCATKGSIFEIKVKKVKDKVIEYKNSNIIIDYSTGKCIWERKKRSRVNSLEI